jgi:ribosomal protein L40E
MATANIILVWIALAIAVGFYAGRRGRTGLGWGVLAVAMSPPFAWLLLVALRDRSKELHHIARVNLKICPHCAMWIRCEATRCRHCHETQPVEGTRQPDYSHLPNRGRALTTFGLAALLFIVALIAIFSYKR